jgi:hypothetical protein
MADAQVGYSKVPFVTLSLSELRGRLQKELAPEEREKIEAAIKQREEAGLDSLRFGIHMTGSQLERALASGEEAAKSRPRLII